MKSLLLALRPRSAPWCLDYTASFGQWTKRRNQAHSAKRIWLDDRPRLTRFIAGGSATESLSHRCLGRAVAGDGQQPGTDYFRSAAGLRGPHASAAHLTRIDPARNTRRFYRLDLQPDLFGGFAIVKEWGRIGRRGGRVAGEWQLTETLAAAAVQRQAERKRRRGYTPEPDFRT